MPRNRGFGGKHSRHAAMEAEKKAKQDKKKRARMGGMHLEAHAARPVPVQAHVEPAPVAEKIRNWNRLKGYGLSAEALGEAGEVVELVVKAKSPAERWEAFQLAETPEARDTVLHALPIEVRQEIINRAMGK